MKTEHTPVGLRRQDDKRLASDGGPVCGRCGARVGGVGYRYRYRYRNFPQGLFLRKHCQSVSLRGKRGVFHGLQEQKFRPGRRGGRGSRARARSWIRARCRHSQISKG